MGKTIFPGELWEKRRCIIPASWYFEWEHLISNTGQKKTGDKYMIQPNGSSMTWLAGLYRIEDSLPVFAVLTREPTDELRRIHDRMPLILPKERIDESPAAFSAPVHLFPAARHSAFHDHWMNLATLGTDFKYSILFNDAVVFQIRFKEFQYG